LQRARRLDVFGTRLQHACGAAPQRAGADLLKRPPNAHAPRSRRLGYKVALLDADIGLRNLDLLLGLENRVLYTAIDILEGECRLDQALIRDKRWKNLSLLSISRNRQR
jgi:hypothetical protein